MISYNKAVDIINNKELCFVEKMKHGDSTSLIQSVMGLNQWALDVLDSRRKDGYFNPGTPPERPFFFGEDSDCSLAERADRLYKLAYYEKDLEQYKANCKYLLTIDEIIYERDGRVAFNILKERSNNEYEQIETVDLAVYS